jgi:transcriptional regulator with XRE-family HTH domain
METTGKTLRLERVAADLSVNAVAGAMGVSRTTLWTIERRAAVPVEQVVAYRDAVARLSRPLTDARGAA